MKTKTIFYQLLPIILLVFTFTVGGMKVMGQTSTQNFGTGTGSYEDFAGSTSFLSNPTSGTTWARSGKNGSYNTPIVLETASNPLGTSGAYLRAVASSTTSVCKFSPIVGYTGGTEFYTSFKVLFGDASAGGTATSGVWTFVQGSGATYTNGNGFSGAHVFTGLQFTFGAGGNIDLVYRVNSPARWSSTLSTLSSATAYTIEIIGNNKSTGTIDYTYNNASESVAIQRFDLYINGAKVGNDLSVSDLPAGDAIDSAAFIGTASTANVANIFVDDVVVNNFIPSSIAGTLSNIIPSLSDDAISIYPVPTTDNMVLRVDGSSTISNQSMSYQLYDINGKLLKTEKIMNKLTTIATDDLSPSLYIVKVFISQRVIKTLKIIKAN